MTANVLAETIIFHVLMDYIYYRWLSDYEGHSIKYAPGTCESLVVALERFMAERNLRE